MNELILWMARKRFEEEMMANRKAWLLAEGLKAQTERLAAEGNTLGSPLTVKP